MRSRTFIGGAAAVLLVAGTSVLASERARSSIDLDRLEGADEAGLVELAASLRTRGRPALEELLALRDELVAAQAPLGNLDRLIDLVGGQRYCAASRLFWHTDVESAIAEAQQSGKPILSLRMLGKLTDELSCANSRFFRTTLYANAEVSKYLRDHFVLHWKSVRPVPKVTIDFGDGRKLERTLTGNSIHYVLTSDGQPVDALPGLYGPTKFLALLRQAEALASKLKPMTRFDRSFYGYLFNYHAARANKITDEWAVDLRRVDPDVAAAQAAPPAEITGEVSDGAPTADLDVSFAKGVIEIGLYRSIAIDPKQLEALTTDPIWSAIAALHSEDALLDEASLALIAAQNPTAAKEMAKMIDKLQSSIAVDTVRNEYTMHRVIHEWFARPQAPSDVEVLNERVYAELFFAANSDPWLGLAPADTYTALENNGIVAESRGPVARASGP